MSTQQRPLLATRPKRSAQTHLVRVRARARARAGAGARVRGRGRARERVRARARANLGGRLEQRHHLVQQLARRRALRRPLLEQG